MRLLLWKWPLGSPKRLAWAAAELGLIVVGVVLGLVLNEWRTGRAERALEHDYLARLERDLEANLDVAASSALWQAAIARNARLVYPLIRHGEPSPQGPASVIAQAYHATPGPVPSWVDDTLQELLSTGRLTLITDPLLRSELLAYYRYLEAADYPFELRSHEYRRLVRERLDPELQLEIRRRCDRESIDCELSTDVDLKEIIDWMSGNQELANALTRVITQSVRAETEYLVRVRESTQRLLDRVRAGLES